MKVLNRFDEIKKMIVIKLLFGTVLFSMMLLAACGNKESKQANIENLNNTDMNQSVDDTTNQKEESVSETEDALKNDVNDNEEESIEELAEGISLKDIYGQHGIKAGTCLSPGMIDNPKTEEIILSQFNSVTLENAMKPDFILKKGKDENEGQIVVEFGTDAIRLLDWAKENNMSLRGHTLVWYSQTPDWIFYEDFDTTKELVSREVMLERMESYISQVFSKLDELGYSDMLYAYDVVNEAWMEDGTMRDNLWKQTIGEDYIWYAFKYAREYAPEHVDLYYNDYNEQYKAGALVRFVETLVDENGNLLIDGIGLQAHLYTLDDMNKYFMAVDKLSKTGLKLSVTELDVALGTWQNTLDASEGNLEKQGEFYYDFVNRIVERKDAESLNIDSLTFWGFADSLSWRKEASPLLYDNSFSPKPAFFGAAQVEGK